MATRRWPTWERRSGLYSALGYEPHAGQLAAHQSGARVVLAAGAERSGKSEWTAKEILGHIWGCRRVAVCADEYDETRSEMTKLRQDLQLVGMLKGRPSTPKVGKWTLETRTGCKVETVSLRNGPQELTGTGLPFDIVAICEAGLVGFESFLAARRRVAETRGRVLLSGTLHDNFGWYADLWRAFEGPNVYGGERFSFPMWMNRAVFPGGRNDPEILELERTLPKDTFARTVAADLLPSPARIYPEFSYSTHVNDDVVFDPSLDVELAVDAGYYPSHYAVLALQTAQKTFKARGGSGYRMEVVRVIDEVWEHHLTHHDVVALCRQREWWPNVRRAVGGHETKQHQAAASTEEVWTQLVGQEPHPGRFRFDVFDAGRIVDGVVRVKSFLKDPGTDAVRLEIAPACTGLQQELQRYKRRTDSKGNTISEEPEDANNDALDALRNWMVDKYGLVDVGRAKVRRGKRRAAARG